MTLVLYVKAFSLNHQDFILNLMLLSFFFVFLLGYGGGG